MNKNFLNDFLETIKILILALIIVLPIRYFIFQPFLVKGISMEPSFNNGDYLIIDEISYRLKNPERGEVIVFYYPKKGFSGYYYFFNLFIFFCPWLDESQRFIKRIIGLPKETIYISNSNIYVATNDGKILAFSTFDSSTVFQIDKDTFNNNLKENTQQIVLGQDEYFVMGDNRMRSYDSRNWGAVSRKEIIGRVILRLWPINNITYFGK